MRCCCLLRRRNRTRRKSFQANKIEEKNERVKQLTTFVFVVADRKHRMDRTPIHDQSMTPSPHTNSGMSGQGASTNSSGVAPSKTMVYICGECHRDNELKSTDVIRCKTNSSDDQHETCRCLSRYGMWLSNLV
jgi:hypothetical protein